jgi:hypothetical protein
MSDEAPIPLDALGLSADTSTSNIEDGMQIINTPQGTLVLPLSSSTCWWRSSFDGIALDEAQRALAGEHFHSKTEGVIYDVTQR